MISDSQMRYGSRVPCQGRPCRPWRRCQRTSFCANSGTHRFYGKVAAASLPHMLAFILRRLAQAVLVMLTVGLIAFSLFTFVGDPVLFMLGQDATPEDRVRVTKLLGLDQPFYVQYANFVARAVQGDFGLSLRQVQPVSRLFVERLPATLELSFVAAILALAFGIPMGIYTALRPHSAL